MDTISVYKNDRNRKKRSKTQQLENIVSGNNEEIFPWLLEFNKSVCSSVGNRNYQHLKRLLLFYTQNILSSVETSNVKFNDEINLKNNINDTLIFFHLYWLDIKQEIADHSLYLNKMSALLSIYTNMELYGIKKIGINMKLRISRQKIVKILAALYIYLNNSEEHIFRVLLRIKHMTEEYTQICNHIFVKGLTSLKIKRMSLNFDVTYIRYLLVFKIWKKIEKLSDKKEKVDELALKLLGPHMPKLRDELLEFVPRPPVNRKNKTIWLLQSDSFNLEQMHKNFLLFEDKMDECFMLHEDQIDKHSLLPEDKIDNSANLQCIEAVYIGQNCSKSQKSNRSNLISNQEENKGLNYLNSLQNDNMLGTKENKSLEKEENRRESREAIIIDLTGDDETSVPCKVKRKKSKPDSKCLKIMKDIMKRKNEKHINSLKYSSQFITSVNIEKSFNRDSKSTAEKFLEYKLNPNNKISDNTKSYTSISNKSPLNNINFQDEHLKNQMNNIYPEFVKEDEIQFDYKFNSNLHYSKFVNQNKESKITSILKGNKTENHDVSSYMMENAIGLYNNTMTQRETLTSEEEMDTIPLLKVCQSDIVDQHSFKQEIPITNCKHVRIKKKSRNDHNSQITDYIIEEVCHQVKCEDCKKIDHKPFIFSNSNSTTQEHSTFTENDVKTCGNIIYIKSDTHYVMPHIDIMTCYDMHTEKRKQCQHDSNDVYTISTTFAEDQIESSLDSQNINLDNKRKCDSKHSETTIKPQLTKNDCDALLSNDRLHPTEHFFPNIDSAFSMYSKEVNEIMETYNGDLSDSENISSFNNQIGILESLENMNETNFLQQSSFELDNVHTNTFFSEKDILCNNQNNAINARVNSIALHLNNLTD